MSQQGCVLSGHSREESLVLPFPAASGYRIPRLMALHQSYLSFCHHISFSDADSSDLS